MNSLRLTDQLADVGMVSGTLGPDLRRGALAGLSCGSIAIYMGAIGMLAMANARPVIAGVLTLAQTMLLLLGVLAGVLAQRRRVDGRRPSPMAAMVAGLVAGTLVGAFALLVASTNLRFIFVALSPALTRVLAFGRDPDQGVGLLVVGAAAAAAIGVALVRMPQRTRRIVLTACSAVLLFGMFQEFLRIVLQSNAVFARIDAVLYSWEGLTVRGAVLVLVLATALAWLTPSRASAPSGSGKADPRTSGKRLGAAGLLVLALLSIPMLGGVYVSQVFLLVGLYVLMGMGLNIELGLAGLLDLGFVAFFATGAYTTALLTADSPLALSSYTAIPSLSFWAAMPISVLMAVAVGALFGIPVLGVKGDYLAIATLGLGEIVRILAQSDAAAPLLGGAQGILQIPKPRIGDFELGSAVSLFYLTLCAAGLAAYCAWRLEGSRLGRAWIALREDEDVAQALGINLVKCKLLAYGFGAAFAGLAGSIFAVMVNSVFPSSFQLLMSINVLALIIVGGLGSLPGVALGALVLIGLPEAFREFGEYRYLFYGVALILTMRLMPEGLWPADRRRARVLAATAAAQQGSPFRATSLQ